MKKSKLKTEQEGNILKRIEIEWSGPGSEGWGYKCYVCWSNYLKGIQHENSLKCYKLGIPFSSFKNFNETIKIINELIKEFKNVTYKFTANPGFLKIITKGVLILYFENEENMLNFIKKFKEKGKNLLKDPSILDDIFYKFAVNTEKIDSCFYYRRGCPEYDFKFGSWKKWKNLEEK